MKRVIIISLAALLTVATPGLAQDEDEGTRLERLIENALSGAGRDVTVRGFRGVLSGRAEMESLTVSDADGVWITISDAVLDWNRLALFRGRLEVAELAAARIDMPRRPTASVSDPLSPEASGTALRLPNLPVALAVDAISAETVDLGPDILGQPVSFTLEGAFQLEDGAGEARLSLERVNGPRGEVALEGAFSNATNELGLSFVLDEAENGVAADLLGLPGTPPLGLSLSIDGALEDFMGDIAIATEGVERFGGTVRGATEQTGQRFTASLDGDLRPLMEPQYRAFFGQRTALEASAIRQTDGITDLSEFSVKTEALTLEGNARIGAEGVPLLFDVAGTLGDPTGGRLLLPVAGAATRLESAAIDLGFDATLGDSWRGRVSVIGLEHDGFNAAEIVLDGNGTITNEPSFTIEMDLAAEALDFGHAETQAAFGEAVNGRVELAWAAGEPVEVGALRVQGESYSAEARGTIADFTSTFDVSGTLGARVEALEIFSGLFGRPLEGRLEATLDGSAGVFTGLADLRAKVSGRGLVAGVEQLDPYLAGDTLIDLAIRRTTSGVFLDRLNLTGPDANISATGQLRTGSGRLSASARVGEIGPLAAGLEGPGSANLDASMSESVWTWSLDANAMASDLVAGGTLTGPLGAPLVTAAGVIDIMDLASFSALAGRPLDGAAEVGFAARAQPGVSRYTLAAEADLRDGAVGLPQVDPLLSGRSGITFAGEIEDDTITVDTFRLASERAVLDASGTVGSELRGLSVNANLAISDIADLVEGLTGRATVALDVEPESEAGPWRFNFTTDAPGVAAEAIGELQDLTGIPEAEAVLQLSVSDLAPFGPLLDRPLNGKVDMSAAGSARADLSRFDIELDGTASGAQTGVSALDQILQGVAALNVRATRDERAITIETFELNTPLLNATANGTIGEATSFGFSAQLADIAPFVEGFSGPFTAEGRAETASGGRAAVEAQLQGPAGARASISGTIAQTADQASLGISGAAPLALINDLIAPRAVTGTAQFDLRVDGPLAIESISGRVTTRGALLTAPVLDVALEDIGATVELASGRAVIDLDSSFRGGGRVRLDGPIGFDAGFPADLAIGFDQIRLTDPTLYQTMLNANLDLVGPLLGGAEISGEVTVGESELRIPSASGGARAGIPDITHVDEPRGARLTRSRAGLIGNDSGRSGTQADFLLDIVVNAPNRIFVRGRGLDAELGGNLRLRGTTRDVAPAGRFDLIRGRLDILGRRLDLTEGSVTLTGALDPIVDLQAETRAEDVDISIIVEGLASNPEIRFESRPELPEDEVLALLLFGQGIESLSPLQIARLASAVATLGSSGGGLLGGLRAGVGLADLDVTSSEDGGTAVRAGAYVADNLYTDVTVDTEGEAVINLNLDLSRSVTVRGTTSNSGNSGVGIFFERDY